MAEQPFTIARLVTNSRKSGRIADIHGTRQPRMEPRRWVAKIRCVGKLSMLVIEIERCEFFPRAAALRQHASHDASRRHPCSILQLTQINPRLSVTIDQPCPCK